MQQLNQHSSAALSPFETQVSWKLARLYHSRFRADTKTLDTYKHMHAIRAVKGRIGARVIVFVDVAKHTNAK